MRKGAGAEVEEVQAGCMSSACPHYIMMAPKEAQSNGQHPVRVAARAACAHHASISASRGRVSTGLSARRLDPRRRRAETAFAAGLDWEGTKRAIVRVLCLCAFCSPRVFFLKRKRGEICIGARLPFPARCLVQVGLDSAYS